MTREEAIRKLREASMQLESDDQAFALLEAMLVEQNADELQCGPMNELDYRRMLKEMDAAEAKEKPDAPAREK